MSKYLLINCYSDNNKGDLGIILSTIDYIRNNDKFAEIEGVSTYNYSDPMFHSEHKLLKKEINVLPSIFGELNIRENKSIHIKFIRFLWDTLRVIFLILLPTPISNRFLFSNKEKISLRRIIEADYIVSKGGSFLCNDVDFRSKIALIRFTYIFLLSFKLKKKVIILNQSIGPVHGKLSVRLINYILQKSFKVVLREKRCIEEYQYLNFPQSTIISNDIAFYLRSKKIDLNFSNDNLNIGLTMKFVDKSKEVKYQNMWVRSIEDILESYQNSVMIIFNQVPIDNDIDASWIIYKQVNDRYKNRIYFITDNYESSELKYLYGQMDMFIGTRLHSTIFAMGETVPTISISYHGTKAEGVFENMQFDKFVIQEYDESILIDKFKQLYRDRINKKINLKEKLSEHRTKMNRDFKNIFINQ